jgi:hypothetical protein
MTPDLEKFYNDLATTGAEGEIRSMIDRHMRGSLTLARTGDFSALADHALKQAIEVLELCAKFAREVESLRAFKRGVDEACNSGDGSYRP